MKFIKFLLIIFITINSPIKADSKQNLINELKQGGKLIFIRHAYAPGGGDPDNFEINDCKTQRNLSDTGREQANKIGYFFRSNNIPINKVYSSEWCRCKETALIAFNKFETKFFLNGVKIKSQNYPDAIYKTYSDKGIFLGLGEVQDSNLKLKQLV